MTRPSNESAVTPSFTSTSFTNIGKRQLGLSALELIGVIALAAMIFVFAATSSNGVASEADLYLARDLVQDSVRMARKNARLKEAEVTLVFEVIPGEHQYQIDIESSSKIQYLRLFDKLTLPQGVVVSSPDLSFKFNQMGQMVSPGFVTLALLGSVPNTVDIQIN